MFAERSAVKLMAFVCITMRAFYMLISDYLERPSGWLMKPRQHLRPMNELMTPIRPDITA